MKTIEERFEELFNTDNNFGQAIYALKSGYKAARKGWNGKGMFVYMVTDKEFTDYGVTPIFNTYSPLYDYNLEPFFVIKNAQGSLNTWVPSVSDMLAEDWEVFK